MAKTDDIASEWHKKVEGRWFGSPSHYDAEGTHVGYSQPRRTIVRGPDEAMAEGLIEDGDAADRVLIDVPGDQFLKGPVKSHIEVEVQSAWVRQTENARIYEGPDFFGAGYPYGSLTLGWVHFAPWKSDSKVFVQILPDKVTQVYDNIQYMGERLQSSLNGMYVLEENYDTDAAVKQRVDAFLQSEKDGGLTQYRTSTRKKGAWTGTLEVFDSAQKKQGDAEVTMAYTPMAHHRARVEVQLKGALNESFTYERYRHGNEFYYEGPDAYGNAIAFGRALYLRQQLRNTGLRIVGREFLLDRDYNQAVIWEMKRGHHTQHVLHGKLDWHSEAKGMDNR